MTSFPLLVFLIFIFYTVTKLTIHNYKQEQKQGMHIIMTLARHVLEYITQIQLLNTPIQFPSYIGKQFNR